jgi:hypothetical protein
MSFFNNLLESTGCNPDGSVGQNPLTSMLDRSMEFLHEHETTSSSEVFFVDGGHVPAEFSLHTQEPHAYQQHNYSFQVSISCLCLFSVDSLCV